MCLGILLAVTRVALQMTAAFMLGLFFQQCGWLAHDFLHHQVFKKRKYGDLFGIFWGNLMQGYSVQWWKNKHNGHHAVPNLHNSTASSQDGDPDIDTMPLLAWSLKQAQSYRELQADGKDSAFVKFMIKNQAIFYFPILLLARLSWLRESFKTSFGLGAASENAALELKAKGLQYPVLEKLGIILHYAWVLAVSTGYGRWSVGYSCLVLFGHDVLLWFPPGPCLWSWTQWHGYLRCRNSSRLLEVASHNDSQHYWWSWIPSSLCRLVLWWTSIPSGPSLVSHHSSS